jgi:spermidine synthase
MTNNRHSGWLDLAILVLCLVISGASALVYQVAWTREFRLVFGATTQASASTVAIVMAGLGLGNLIFGRTADQMRFPIRVYALLELGIFATAAISPFLIDLVRFVYVFLGGQSALGMAADPIRLLLSLGVLFIPATFMGGTLPVAACAAVGKSDLQRRGLAWLYGGNTVGAVIGTFGANFYALPNWGTRATLWSACVLNLVAVGIALLWSFRGSGRNVELSAGSAGSTDNLHPARESSNTSSSEGLIYLACGLVGFVYFSMEIVWFRMLAPLLGGTTFTFGLILGLALLGIGIGAWLYPFFARWGEAGWGTLAGLCGIEAFVLSLPIFWGDGLAMWAADLYDGRANFFEQVVGWSYVAGFVVIPTSLVAGIQFPALIAALGKGAKDVGRQVGIACAFNTLGAVLGSLLTGFLLLPWMAAPGLWRLNVMFLVVLAILMLRKERPAWSRKLRYFNGPVLVLTSIIALVSRGPTAAWRHSEIGAGRSNFATLNTSELREGWLRVQRRTTEWEIEGREASVALRVSDGYSFSVNGKTDGNAVMDATTQVMAGLVGAILHPRPRECLVVGLGTGETAGWLASVSDMQKVDVVEIEGAIVEIAKTCTAVNQDVLNRPNVNLIVEDAREVLLTRKETYDVIVSVPSNPYRVGIANLFTQEFYRGCRTRLRPDGLFVQWLQAYETDAETVRTVLATLRTEFQSVEIWQGEFKDLMLLCTNEPRPYSVERIAQRLREPVIARGLQVAWRAEDPADFWSHYLLSPEGVDAYIDGLSIINSDDWNRIEYGYARTLGKSSDFSEGDLASMARGFKYDLPETTEGTLDRDRIFHCRQVMELSNRQQSYRPNQLSETHRLRVQLFALFDEGKSNAMIELVKANRWEPTNATERIYICLAAAEIGDTETLEHLLSAVRNFLPAEAELVQAIRYSRAEDLTNLVDSLERLWTAMRDNPWMEKKLRDRVYRLFRYAGEQSPQAAQHLYDVLAEPLAAGALEDDRLVTRCWLGKSLSKHQFRKAIDALKRNHPVELDAQVKAFGL